MSIPEKIRQFSKIVFPVPIAAGCTKMLVSAQPLSSSLSGFKIIPQPRQTRLIHRTLAGMHLSPSHLSRTHYSPCIYSSTCQGANVTTKAEQQEESTKQARTHALREPSCIFSDQDFNGCFSFRRHSTSSRQLHSHPPFEKNPVKNPRLGTGRLSA